MDEHQLGVVVQQFVEHPEIRRIYKLLYWAQLHHWENDEAVLNRYPLHALLEGIASQVSSATELEQLLAKSASQLTKPTQYQAIAKIIADVSAPLYCESGEEAAPTVTVAKSAEPSTVELPCTSFAGVEQISLPSIVTSGRSLTLDRFDLRHDLMREVPPLKAKILLFSVLRHPFTFSRADWWELKALTLDEWMMELLHCFSSFGELEAILNQQAAALISLDQREQVAIAIAKTARLKYSDGCVTP
jgi:hypothetical protein